jgi:polysaccharide deacetylase family protein (PEP-CTERM system associated)
MAGIALTPPASIDLPSSERGVCVADAATLTAFTVDLEDWAQGLLGGDTPITPRVVKNTDRMLDLLDEYGIRATFFALGRVCAKFPWLLPTIVERGHEVASHGFGHDPVYTLTPVRFEDDMRRSIDVITSQTGTSPLGYRAPQFSVTPDTMWVGPILNKLGFVYSSSVFPIQGFRYGISDAPAYPFRWRDWTTFTGAPISRAADTGSLVEFPMTTLRCFGKRWPVCGGGWLRLLPGAILLRALAQARSAGQPGVIYMHPYELATKEVAELRREFRIPLRRAVNQSIFRSRIRPRLVKAFKARRFAPMCEIISS